WASFRRCLSKGPMIGLSSSYDKLRAIVSRSIPHPSQVDKDVSTLIQILVFLPLIPNVVLHVEYGS
ncbi:hypothetical protein ACVR5S_004407, partial [Salmonella enterica subsp. enterica serovar Bredeney]